MTKFHKINGVWREISKYYQKTNGAWAEISEASFESYLNANPLPSQFGGFVTVDFVLGGPRNVSGETCSFTAVYEGLNVTSAATWSLVSGGQYATMTDYVMTIATGASNSTVTISATYNGNTTTKDVVLTYKAGTTTETQTETEVDESGNTTTTTTTITENEDGSSSSESVTIVTDESGNTLETTETVTEVNSDGSFTGASTTYDSSGNPTESVNQSGDTSGNVETQQVTYDESGTSAVTGYEIDTTDSQGQGKGMRGDGVNTEFVPFCDDNCGFICHIKFTSEAASQPRPPIVEDTEDTGNNWLYNILCAKAATPLPTGGWPGFDIRWALSKSNGTGSIQFRYTQSGSTSTTSRTLNGKNDAGTASGNVYDLIITYDPEKLLPNSRTTFSVTSPNGCISSIGTDVYFVSNNIDFTLGYATNMQGEPYRYSDVTIHEFSITKICSSPIVTPEAPVIGCDGEYVTISCLTAGADIYYRLGSSGNYSPYTAPIALSATTTVYAYSEYLTVASNTVSANCVYAESVASPVISCDGEYVTITCETPSADIYYKLGDAVSYNEYTDAVAITADTVVWSYAVMDGHSSLTVSSTCVYEPGVKTPVITCDGEYVTITCVTTAATIYYKLTEGGTYAQYSTPVQLSADTVVYAYSVSGTDSSTTVSANCVYNPVHDYSLDYLTLCAITSGTILWKNSGNVEKTIMYSKNNGQTWTSITSTTAGTEINVTAGEKVLVKGTNEQYATKKDYNSRFEGGTALFNVEGNVMSLIGGDNFTGVTSFTKSWALHSLFNRSNVVSAKNLVLPVMTLTEACYRAMFANAANLIEAPALPATTLAKDCYWYMFENCPITEAPVLPALTLVQGCYGNMFTGCTSLEYIKCLATNISASACTTAWVKSVAASGTFVKASGMTWSVGVNGIPSNWVVLEDGAVLVESPEISCDGEHVTMTCATAGAIIYYKLDGAATYSTYSAAITITANTLVEAYAEHQGQSSTTTAQNCEYISSVPLEASNRTLGTWTYNNQTIQTPYSVNAIDGHSATYAKGTFNFETSFALREPQTTYLWFQHADQSATIYVDNNLVEKHWGGYNAFFVDISNYVHSGTNQVKVALKNNEGNYLAPATGDFNYNATIGEVKLFTSPVVPSAYYGYDGFHVVADVASSSATINVKTSVPTGATVTCEIDDGTYHFGSSANSTGNEMVFSATVTNPHLWHGTVDPHLYNITLRIYHNGDLYHQYVRPYGLRFFDYAYSGETSGGTTGITYNGSAYTGFLLNGSPYFLRGVCMHDDVEGKANALNAADYNQEFSIIQELGCNFIRLAHYPHPKEVYDRCDQLGVIVQTEAPWVGKANTGMPTDYYTHLEGQFNDMVLQHYNHPCIVFWGLSNETTTDNTTEAKDFAKAKIEGYTAQIKALDSSRWVGYVMSHSFNNPSSYYNNPNVDWFGGNIYVGWYIDKASNDPTSQLTTRCNNIIKNLHKPLAFSEYGCGGTQHCHSDDPQTTTTKGNYERHDIEYQMWLHEGHIAAIRNFPQLLFTGEWQLFDIAVSTRNEGYTVCLDGENASTDDNLRRLNNKGLVERDHVTKKDTFYIYKAEWNPTDKFVHICGKDYTKKTGRVIKCYTNDENNGTLTLYVNGVPHGTTPVTSHIAEFTSDSYNAGDIIRVEGATSYDTFTF